MKIKYDKVLCFFAHPDDETLAMGGTIAKLVEANVHVKVVISNTGIASRRDKLSEEDVASQLQNLKEDCSKALCNLGILHDDIILGEFSDNESDKHTLLELNHWIEPILDDFMPDAIFTHHRFCTNIDHQYCYNSAVVATRPGLNFNIDFYTCEVPSSTGYLKPTQFEPNCFVGLEERHVSAKIKSMNTYKGEARPYPHPRSGEVLKALAQVRGSEAGCFFAEAFMLNRLYPL
ncbi:PIG-L family deacetylase [Pseudodesulfovibrio thermohalotolerans]|uniref:PIG-L deacetylase family protein n=1 Tax=Pseudodesulfovibrio thermohalotolerans TaxID=2880651 RepID=UPI0024430EFA|nr:PIG-L family deacetylase [Pseudodesulfovibrio thermohalotolerans]WFS62280.1 PIG-L family deacetylase [Pseudodesulfovibrio thermohalotolerans]